MSKECVISIQDGVDTSTAMGKFFFRVMASLAELERDIIVERTRAGLKAARARGKKGDRPFKNQNKVNMAIKMYHSKEYTIQQITEATGLGKTTLYRYLDKGQKRKIEKEVIIMRYNFRKCYFSYQ